MGVSPGNGGSATSVRIIYSENLLRPAIAGTKTSALMAASILSRKGTSELRKFIEDMLQWPAPGSLEDLALQEGAAELVQYWEDEFAGGFDPSSVEDDDPARYDECDRLVIGWIADGHVPEGREMILELAWPGTLAAITQDAENYFPSRTEKKIEDEEISSYRARRWMDATQPFKSANWLPRAEMWSAYQVWCTADGSGRPGSPKEFYDSLKALGCAEAGRKGVRGFRPPQRSNSIEHS